MLQLDDMSDLETNQLLMYNMHSGLERGTDIDSILSCTEGLGSQRAASQGSVCGLLTDVDGVLSDLVRDPSFEPALTDLQSILAIPIFPAKQPTTMVGLTGAVMTWSTLLDIATPSDLDGFDLVLSTDSTHQSGTATRRYTYRVENGKPRFLGEGDHHDPQYDSYGRSRNLLDGQIAQSSRVSFKLTVYPRDSYVESFSSGTPLFVCISAVVLIALLTLLFVAYDWAMRREAWERQAVMDTKRRYVRFISHEVRTPLNTMYLGLNLLEMELQELTSAVLGFQQQSQQVQQSEQGEQSSGFGLSDRATINTEHLRSYSSDSADDDKVRCAASFSGKESRHENTIDKPLVGLVLLVQQRLQSWRCLTEEISSNASNAVNVLNDLLNYDKIESGTLHLTLTTVPIWQLLRRTVRDFGMSATQSSVTLELQCERWASGPAGLAGLAGLAGPAGPAGSAGPAGPAGVGGPGVGVGVGEPTGMGGEGAGCPSKARAAELDALQLVADEQRMAQVIANLVSNAIKFTPSGGRVLVSGGSRLLCAQQFYAN